MSKEERPLPLTLPTKDVLRALRKAGAYLDRHGKGSHDIYVRPLKNGKKAVIPIKTTEKVIPAGTLRAIIREAKMTPEQFMRYLGGAFLWLAPLWQLARRFGFGAVVPCA